MRILHLCLACFYIDGYNYQENVLPRLSHEKGHDVRIIASTETYISNMHLGYVEPKEYITEYGVPIKRLAYKKIFSDKVSRKIRYYEGLYKEIDEFKPDIIYSHDLSYASVDDVVKYIKSHSGVCLLADTHTAFYNSGQNWISLNILHRVIYGNHIKKAIPYISKYYYIGPSERDFSKQIYGIPDNLMEFLPLGGVIPNKDEKNNLRIQFRKEFEIDDELMLVHSGKIVPEKKTAELLRSFSRNKDMNAKLILIGSISESCTDEINSLIASDERIIYVGWKQPEYLLGCLCAADLYCQPGTPSATLQNAICCGTAVLAYPYEGYTLLDKGNFLWVENEEDIATQFKNISEGIIDIDILKKHSEECASEYLDYNEMEERIRAEYLL